jgi:asparagine synthase (glutamine-hydrolysing)
MCGINGIIPNSPLDLTESLYLMTQSIKHRGPDKQAVWIDELQHVGFGHDRLSILDLSESGNQPMTSHSGRYTIVFNGEIYNYHSLKKELDLHQTILWRGTSDTEILLESIEYFGVVETLKKCNGMFAFGLYDKKEGTLTLARDRMGEKPLYYGWSSSNFVFSSELRAIQSLPFFKNKISKNTLGLYLQYSSVPEPYSIYDDIYKLEAGHCLCFNLKTKKYEISSYWSLESNPEKLFYETDNIAIDTLDKLLQSSVGLQMQADVPTGAFLSGGIDSSTIAAIMQSLSTNKIDTFTIGFHEKSYNEAEFAKNVAKHIGSNHHELYVGEKDLLDVVPKLSTIYSEPFAEASQIPTYLVSKIAKQHVTVALSGDAGDELFGGYWRYHFTNNLWNKLNKIPYPIRNSVSKMTQSSPFFLWKILLSPLAFKKGNYGKKLNYPDKFLKLLPLLQMKSEKELYHRGIMTHNLNIHKLLMSYEELPTVFSKENSPLSTYEMMMYYDLRTYLPNNNLTKVDRAAMAVSLETRVPLLDTNIVAFAQSLPLEYKIRNNVDKWILKQVLYRYIPEELFNRPKKGFEVPLEEWLRGSLKEWAAELLNEKTLKEQGFFDVSEVQKYWSEHQSGKRNWSAQLWDIIIFQDWLKNQSK